MKNLISGIIISLLLSCLFTACGDGDAVTEPAESSETAAETETQKEVRKEAEWAVYWYLCGSNLESGGQSATKDLSEMLSVKLPEDVKVVIQTGGSRLWHLNGISADSVHRFTAENGELKEQEKIPQENMGKAGTLSGFITYCFNEFPAEHTMLIMWDHGGGTLGGVSYDMNYNMDSIMLPELKEALSKGIPEGKKLDIIGFDACLMSSIDVVESCAEHADYLLSSQQLEPASGWDYRKIAEELAGSAAPSPEKLGRAVCDSYYESCEREGLAQIATLSLIDLNTAKGVLWHYDEMIKAMFDEALQSDEKAASIRRAAYGSENYGENGRDIGYTNMVDLKGFAAEGNFAKEAFLSLIDSAVVYQVRGEISPDGCGISCYYPLDASLRSVYQYAKAADSGNDVYLFYRYMLSPEYDGEVEAYAGEQKLSKFMREMRYVVTDMDLGSVESSVLKMEPQESKRLSNVRVAANRVTADKNGYIGTELGEIPCSKADYDSGIFDFDDDFKCVTADESSFATYVYSQSGDRFNCYSPAVVDGEDAVLLFTADKKTGEVISNGAVTGKTHNSGKYDPKGAGIEDDPPDFINNRIVPLREDQVVTPLYKETVYGKYNEITETWREGKPVVIGKSIKFGLETPDGEISFSYIVTDAWGNEGITENFRVYREEETTEETAPETEPETRRPVRRTEAPAPVPETETETTIEETTAPPETLPDSVEYYYSDYDDDYEYDYIDDYDDDDYEPDTTELTTELTTEPTAEPSEETTPEETDNTTAPTEEKKTPGGTTPAESESETPSGSTPAESEEETSGFDPGTNQSQPDPSAAGGGEYSPAAGR